MPPLPQELALERALAALEHRIGEPAAKAVAHDVGCFIATMTRLGRDGAHVDNVLAFIADAWAAIGSHQAN